MTTQPMNCANCLTRPAEFLCHKAGKKPVLCSECLRQSRTLFYAWERLGYFPVCISIPRHIREKWAHEILIDGLKTRLPQNEIAVSRVGKKGFASFFALETN